MKIEVKEILNKKKEMNEWKIKENEQYYYDDEFENEKLVDVVKILENRSTGKVLVYSPKLRANILLPIDNLGRKVVE